MTMHTVFPVPGRLIRDPFTRTPVPDAGQPVPVGDAYWSRALADGDVTLTAPSAAPQTTAVPAAPAAPSDKG